MNTTANHLTKPEYTMLLAEDDPDDVFLFRRALREANFNTRVWVRVTARKRLIISIARVRSPR